MADLNEEVRTALTNAKPSLLLLQDHYWKTGPDQEFLDRLRGHFRPNSIEGIFTYEPQPDIDGFIDPDVKPRHEVIYHSFPNKKAVIVELNRKNRSWYHEDLAEALYGDADFHEHLKKWNSEFLQITPQFSRMLTLLSEWGSDNLDKLISFMREIRDSEIDGLKDGSQQSVYIAHYLPDQIKEQITRDLISRLLPRYEAEVRQRTEAWLRRPVHRVGPSVYMVHNDDGSYQLRGSLKSLVALVHRLEEQLMVQSPGWEDLIDVRHLSPYRAAPTDSEVATEFDKLDMSAYLPIQS